MNLSNLKKILVVDDDPDLQKIAKLSLEKKGGFIVRVCDSGKQTLLDVKTFQPDLILLDVVLPDMNGMEILSALRKLPEAAQIPVFFLTARVSPQETEKYKELGAAGLIRKPFYPMKLSDQVKELWKQI